MVNFEKPLLIRDKFGNIRTDQTVRVIATDRICPVDFCYVLLVRNPKAMFGDEEFIITAREDGTISGRGFDGVVFNP